MGFGDPAALVQLAVALAAGYLLGAIPFGLIVTKLAGLGDIRAIGSGNIGATNVLRTGRKGLAALTLLLDAGKGAAAVLIAQALVGHPTFHLYAWPEAVGLGALLGHIFPVWLKFKGGKGVATAFGVFLALSWPVALAGAATWLAVALIFRISSLAALAAFALTPVYAWTWADQPALLLAVVVAAIVILTHHANIRRLLTGQEPRIGR